MTFEAFMKLSIRWKYFLLLLAFSLVPLLGMRELLGVLGARVVDEVATSARRDVGALIRQGLLNAVTGAAEILEGEGTAYALSAEMLADTAAHKLTSPPSELVEELRRRVGPDAEVENHYFLIDRTSGSPVMGPPAESGERYFRMDRKGRGRSLSVDRDRLGVLLPVGMSREMARSEIDALAAMLPEIRALYRSLDSSPFWIHVDLESGVRAIYPGHKGYPLMYDHRLTEWYRRAKRSDREAVWTSPVVDPVTRQVVGSISQPIRDRDGRLLGVATLDISLSKLLQENRLKDQWGGDQSSFLVVRDNHPEGGRGLLVVAQREYGDGLANWQLGIRREWLESEAETEFAHFVERVETESSGIAEMPYRGEPALWAFASKPSYTFMVILPVKAVEEYPGKVHATIEGLFDKLREYSQWAILALLGAVGAVALYWSNKSTAPLLSMADTAKRLSDGDFSARMDQCFGDERDALISTFNEMGPRLREHMRIRRDMELASTVQELLLPRENPDLPGFEIAGALLYSEQTGGDYFDYLPVRGKDRPAQAVVVGDVTGHGMQAALLMATARALLHGLSGARLPLGDRVSLVNRSLSADLEDTGRFMTMFYLQLEVGSDVIKWVRAGHDPAFTLKPGSNEFGRLEEGGLPLGVDPDMAYESHEGRLEPGELVILATDGIWEACSQEGEMFGKNRFLAIIRQNRDKEVGEIVSAVFREVNAFAGSARREDDMTMVVIRRKTESPEWT